MHPRFDKVALEQQQKAAMQSVWLLFFFLIIFNPYSIISLNDSKNGLSH